VRALPRAPRRPLERPGDLRRVRQRAPRMGALPRRRRRGARAAGIERLPPERRPAWACRDCRPRAPPPPMGSTQSGVELLRPALVASGAPPAAGASAPPLELHRSRRGAATRGARAALRGAWRAGFSFKPKCAPGSLCQLPLEPLACVALPRAAARPQPAPRRPPCLRGPGGTPPSPQGLAPSCPAPSGRDSTGRWRRRWAPPATGVTRRPKTRLRAPRTILGRSAPRKLRRARRKLLYASVSPRARGELRAARQVRFAGRSRARARAGGRRARTRARARLLFTGVCAQVPGLHFGRVCVSRL